MYTNITLLITRISFSLAMMTHGYPKLIKLFSESPSFKRKELALLYLVGFLIVLLMGPGKYSLDKK